MRVICLFLFILAFQIFAQCAETRKVLQKSSILSTVLRRSKRQTNGKDKVTFFESNEAPQSQPPTGEIVKGRPISDGIPVQPQDIRLRGDTPGMNPNEGRIEIFRNGMWSPVCDDYWGKTQSQVACIQLGYFRGGQTGWRNDHFGRGHWILSDVLSSSTVRCYGTETRLQDCGIEKLLGCTGSTSGVTCLYNPGCDTGWTSFNGACYRVVGDPLDFLGAQKACNDLGAKLTYILQKDENNFITNMLYTMLPNISAVWTGGNYIEVTEYNQKKSRWSWADTIHSVENWRAAPIWFPGFYGGTEGKRPVGDVKLRSCIALNRLYTDSKRNNKIADVNYFWWDNLSCKTQLPFICQKNIPRGRSDCYNDIGLDYRGSASRTDQGTVCAKWTHADAVVNPDTNPNMGLGDHNHCRNPDGDARPWCWVDPTRAVFGYCALARCDVAVESEVPATVAPVDPPGFGKGGCSSDKFFCPSMIHYNRPCITRQKVCDQYPDCDSREDEDSKFCQDHLCADNEYFCAKDKYCILNSYVCNGNRDCSDASDEKNCTQIGDKQVLEKFEPYANKQLKVQDMQIYYSKTLPQCVELCVSSFFRNGYICKSINFYQPTDGARYYSQCELLSQTMQDVTPDKLIDNPESVYYHPKLVCNTDTFNCTNGKCISSKLACDGKNDCGDFSDESQCEKPQVTAPAFEIRLSGGTGKWEGRVEVRYQGEWGIVCDDKFDMNAAQVVCRQLGYPEAVGPVQLAWRRFGRGNENFLMDEVICNGSEKNITDCQHSPWRQHDCNRDEIAGVVCATDRACLINEFRCGDPRKCISYLRVCDGVKDCDDNGDEWPDCILRVKLENGTDKSGRVLIRRGEISGTVCDDMFDDKDAAVICKMLNIPGRAQAANDGRFGAGRGLMLLSNLQCTGTEASLDKCPDFHWGVSSCEHKEDAGVICGLPELQPTTTPQSTPAPSVVTPAGPKIECGKRTVVQGGRVVGGFQANYGAYPWQVGVRLKFSSSDSTSHWCGGTILSEFWIVSAAHCFAKPKTNYRVRVGDLNNNEADQYEQEFEIQNLILHPNWTPSTYDFDLALIRISPGANGLGIQFSEYVQPACLPKKGQVPDPRRRCHVSGWGDTLSEYPEHLMAAEVPLITEAECDRMYKGRITERMHCAGFATGGIDTCQGDSGGPLVCLSDEKYTIWGATSWGNGCAQPNNPGVYTRIAVLLDWVHGIAGNNNM